MEELNVVCHTGETVDWKAIESIQGSLKSITDPNLSKLKKNIIEIGFAFPIHVWKDKGTLKSIDGWHRKLALLSLESDGMSIPDLLPAVFIDAKDEIHAKQLLLSASSRYAKINEEYLLDFIKDIDLDFMSENIDIPELDLNALLDKPEETENDDVLPEAPEPISKSGDLWELGDHRLLCGDSSDVASYKILFENLKADMVFTDPPYGVAIGEKNRLLNSFQKAGRNLSDIKNDTLDPIELEKMLVGCFNNICAYSKDDASFYVTAPQGGELGMMVMEVMRKAHIPVRHVLIWVKNAPTFSLGRLDYDYQHEPILYSWRKKHRFYGNGTQKKSVWNFNRPQKSSDHPTMKPVELIENAILNSTERGMILADIFAGSGSAVIACEKTGRRCFGIEYEPGYCDLIVKRYHQWCLDNSRTPILKRNGSEFSW